MPKASAAKVKKPKAKTKKPKATSKQCRGSYNGGAKQCLLDVIASLTTSPLYSSAKAVPRAKVEAYMKVLGINGASTVRSVVGKSKVEGLICVDGKDIRLTEEGKKRSNILEDMSSSSNEEYQRKKIASAKLNDKAKMLLDFVKDGNAHSKQTVLDELGMKANSTWRAMLCALKRNEFIKIEADMIELSDEMFPLGRD